MKNIGSTRTKGVNIKNYTPVHCVSQNPIILQNLKCVGATVIEFSLFNQIMKKKNKENNIAIL